MELKFNSLAALFKAFPDDMSARKYLEARIWNGCPVCPHCECARYYKLKDGKRYRCASCKKDYTITTNTPFHGTHLDLNLILAAMYLVVNEKKGLSSVSLASKIGITQKSAWLLLHKLRDVIRPKKMVKLKGIIECDEAYMGRKFLPQMKYLTKEEKKYRIGDAYSKENLGVLFGMIQRDGNVVVWSYDRIDGDDIKSDIKTHVEKHSWLITDGANYYKTGLPNFKHESVIHSRKEYVRGDFYTNNIENFWGIMKRGIYGTYHQVSTKHLQRYSDEYTFRHNTRKLTNYERFELSLNNPKGRLTYKQLTSNDRQKKEKYQEPKTEWD